MSTKCSTLITLGFTQHSATLELTFRVKVIPPVIVIGVVVIRELTIGKHELGHVVEHVHVAVKIHIEKHGHPPLLQTNRQTASPPLTRKKQSPTPTSRYLVPPRSASSPNSSLVIVCTEYPSQA